MRRSGNGITMMTSSNVNIFCLTGPLYGEFTGHRWIPLTKASDTLMFSFICAWINGWINNREAGDLRRHRAHYDVTAMQYKKNDRTQKHKDTLKLLMQLKFIFGLFIAKPNGKQTIIIFMFVSVHKFNTNYQSCFLLTHSIWWSHFTLGKGYTMQMIIHASSKPHRTQIGYGEYRLWMTNKQLNVFSAVRKGISNVFHFTINYFQLHFVFDLATVLLIKGSHRI